MRFVNADGSLDSRSHTRSYREEVEMALSALDCALNSQKAVYASSELTTGRRISRLMQAHGVADSSALKQKLGKSGYESLLWNPNVAAATAFAQRLRAHLRGKEMVITPAPLLAPGWEQAEYLGFWETLIRTRVKKVYFNEDWQYSNGCTFEFAVAQDAGLPALDATGEPIPLDVGIRLIEAAVAELEADGVEQKGLRANLTLLRRLQKASITL
jgi:hypothetical protein